MKRAAPYLLGLTIVGCAVTSVVEPQLLTAATTDPDLLVSVVGQVERRCCRPGRRWGCDPSNFNQTGCVHIEKVYPSCRPGRRTTMTCSSASCQPSGSEDVCSIIVRNVGLNVCQPTGSRTTVGCPPDHWQCQIDMIRYDSDDAPRGERYVCHADESTICGSGYSHCD